MQITWGGIIFLLIIVLVIVGLIAYNRFKNGKGFNIGLTMPNFHEKPSFRRTHKEKSEVAIGTPCFSIYKNKMVVENIENVDSLYTWDIINKPYVFQGCVDGVYSLIKLSDDITYQPDRLARMIGCMPLKRLKSLKFSILENLAPFAPVVALLIGLILYLVVAGD